MPHKYFSLPPIITYMLLALLLFGIWQQYRQSGILGVITQLALFGLFFWLGMMSRDL